jgi:hypothetical protein
MLMSLMYAHTVILVGFIARSLHIKLSQYTLHRFGADVDP